MVDVKKHVKGRIDNAKERIDTAKETVKEARSTLTDVIAKAEKAGREQFQELVALGGKYEPRVSEALESRFGDRLDPVLNKVRGFIADNSAEAEKPKTAARKPAARKPAAKKPAAKKTVAKKPAAKKPATTTRAKASPAKAKA